MEKIKVFEEAFEANASCSVTMFDRTYNLCNGDTLILDVVLVVDGPEGVLIQVSKKPKIKRYRNRKLLLV